MGYSFSAVIIYIFYFILRMYLIIYHIYCL